MLPNGPSMHCGPRYRHYNDICFCSNYNLSLRENEAANHCFQNVRHSCESWHNVFPCLYSNMCPNTAAQKQRSTSRSFSFKQSPLHLTTDYSTQKSLSHLAGFQYLGGVKTLKPCRFFNRTGPHPSFIKNIDRSAGFLSSASPLLHHLITSKRYTKNRPRLYNETDLVADEGT